MSTTWRVPLSITAEDGTASTGPAAAGVAISTLAYMAARSA